MVKILIYKLSIIGLGLLLMATSAITAAILPGKVDSKRVSNNNGTLRNNSAGDGGAQEISCIPDVDMAYSCTATLITETTQPGQPESFNAFGKQTVGNTSQTFAIPDGPGGADQTSDLQ